MKKWVKFFTLSFFSNKIAKQAINYGVASIFLALLLSYVFFLLGFYGADVLPFSHYYENAVQFTNFIDDAFSDISLTLEDGKANSDKKINSYESDTQYARYGYNLILDTRPMDMFIEFTQIATADGNEISYEEYISLDDMEKNNYILKTIYTDREVNLTDESVKVYKEFLSTNEHAMDEYAALDMGAQDYNKQLYSLYVKYYYTSVNSALYGEKVPVLRDFYYRNYISIGGNFHYLFVFDNMIAGSFETDGGIPIIFGGYFNKLPDQTVSDIDAFIKEVYYSNAGRFAINYVIGAMKQFLILVIITVFICLIMWIALKFVTNGLDLSFSGCYKSVNSFVWFSSFTASLITFICGWFTPAQTMFSLMPLLFGGILLIRTALFCIFTTVQNRKARVDEYQCL